MVLVRARGCVPCFLDEVGVVAAALGYGVGGWSEI